MKLHTRMSMLIGFLILAIPLGLLYADSLDLPSGYSRVADDRGASPSPHLLLGSTYHFQEQQVPTDKVKADDPARSILHDATAIVLDYRGLQQDSQYLIRMTFLSDHPDGPRFPQRVVRVKADGVVLAERIELPQDEVAIKSFPLPPECFAGDGSVVLRIEKTAGHNAVVSRVEVFSDHDVPLADIILPAVFNDHMVLQRGCPIPIWGHAAPGQLVSVQFGDDKVSSTADDQGRWQVYLPTRSAGGPHTLTVTGARPLVLRDVLVGDIWICSGQSNMEMRLEQDKFFGETKQQIDNPNIRLLRIPALWSAGPATKMIGDWQACDATSAPAFSAAGYYFGKELEQELDIPIGLIQAAIGGTPIENWTPGPTGHWYNGMMHPMLPFAIRGAIWYQAESNIESGSNYLRQMQDLIGGWRNVWGQGQFPVYFVQLAPYRHRDDGSSLPVIWEAQFKSLQIPNTGMAVTTDIGEGDLHPPNKREVGHRLALWALAKTYDRKDLVYSGPLYRHYLIRGDRILLEFDHVGSGLASRNGQPLDWFEIAGKDGKFVPAVATIAGSTVSVSSPQVARPVAVRFGWDQLANPNLMNREGLPASPFRTP